MTGHRESAWLREMHDEGRCPDDCPLCARIEQAQAREQQGPHDYLTVDEYEER